MIKCERLFAAHIAKRARPNLANGVICIPSVIGQSLTENLALEAVALVMMTNSVDKPLNVCASSGAAETMCRLKLYSE